MSESTTVKVVRSSADPGPRTSEHVHNSCDRILFVHEQESRNHEQEIQDQIPAYALHVCEIVCLYLTHEHASRHTICLETEREDSCAMIRRHHLSCA